MHKYRNWRELLVGVTLLCSAAFGGCTEHRGVQEEPAPPILTVEQVVLNHSSYVGIEVLLQGQFVADTNSSYYLVSQLQPETQTQSEQYRIAVDFGLNLPDATKIANCHDKATIILGEILDTDAISATFVKLQTDARKHTGRSCYEAPFDSE